MHHNDVKFARLTRNLRILAEGATLHSETEAERLKQAVSNARNAATAAAISPVKKKKRGRAAVVAWDMGHNPVGRAYVLYRLLEKDWDVDLIGPMWSRYGKEIWEPLRGSELNIRSFHCEDLTDFLPKAEALVATKTYDMVYVCKPRLPSLFLGALLKDASGCPLVLDVDDFELSFFKDESTASLDELKAGAEVALHEPFEELGTRYAQSLISTADAVTVSNVALRGKFGGHIVRHARDEEEFLNTAERRQSARERLGISDSDFALMFIGTPRPHKGVLEVARALDELDDPSIVFHIVGDISDQALRESLQSYSRARIVCHPNCAFEELPVLLAGADLVPLIQDTSHAISQFQIPAKVSDALSLGVPVLATSTPPLKDLIAAGTIHETDTERLADSIRELKNKAQSNVLAGSDNTVSEERRNFVNELGMGVNRARLEQAILEAQARVAAGAEVIEEEAMVVSPVVPFLRSTSRDFGDARLPEPWNDMVQLFRDHYRLLRSREIDVSRERRGEPSLAVAAKRANGGTSARVRRYLPAIISGRSKSYDIAFFWKQNDSGMYGRRSDMIAKGLAESGRVNQMVHFDAPVSAPSLNQHFSSKQREVNGQQELILKNLVDRRLGIYDTHVMKSRTFVHSGQEQRSRIAGLAIDRKESYVRYVNEQLEAAGMRANRTLAWFCPVIWDVHELINKVGFAGVIADLIDDQRAWDCKADWRRKLEANYRNTLGAADIVFANCDLLADSMTQYAPNIHVVPNGAERFERFPMAEKPASLQGIKGPVAGYVGNMRDRIDWMLLHEVVQAMPDVSFVFYGPSSDNPNADSLAKHDNVHILGVIPYAELPFHLRSFDVGLVPHLNNQLTERMNPLKVYNYFAAGLPVVSSEINNLEDLGSALQTGRNATEFVQAIRTSLANPVDTKSAGWQRTMDTIAWDTRVNSILSVMDQSLRRGWKLSA